VLNKQMEFNAAWCNMSFYACIIVLRRVLKGLFWINDRIYFLQQLLFK